MSAEQRNSNEGRSASARSAARQGTGIFLKFFLPLYVTSLIVAGIVFWAQHLAGLELTHTRERSEVRVLQRVALTDMKSIFSDLRVLATYHPL
jgi:hypothetical protein